MLDFRAHPYPEARTPRALVLAAGDGDRLAPYTTSVPKPLLAVAGRPLIAHVLEGLFDAGVRETAIVVGYRADQMRHALPPVAPRGMALRFVDNNAYTLGNARSLWAARAAVEPPFVLAMADHIVDPAITRAVMRGARDRCRLAVDRAAPGDPRAEEATRALVRDGRVVDLGKSLSAWDALDTGTFWCTGDAFAALAAGDRDGALGAVYAHRARAGRLEAVDVTGARGIDVDTPEDLAAAEEILEADGLVA
jgi:choline kinase